MWPKGVKSKFIDRVGHQFGRLVVLKRMENDKHYQVRFLCRCQCGKEIIVLSRHLKSGNTQSCGCYLKERLSESTTERSTKHGMNKRGHQTKSYRTWAHMKERCENPNCRDYKNYGGRGVKLCDYWQTFENFYKSMGDPPTPKHTIERINNNENYEANNCRWTTRKEQNNNTRANRIIEFNGQRKTLAQWSESTGINYNTLRTRLGNGWPIEKALTQNARLGIPTEAC